MNVCMVALATEKLSQCNVAEANEAVQIMALLLTNGDKCNISGLTSLNLIFFICLMGIVSSPHRVVVRI